MKYVRILLLLSLLATASCTHLVIDSTERLQIKNLSGERIAKFSIIGERDTIVWIPDTVAPGELSFVHEEDFVGSFRALFFAEDSSGSWSPVNLGRVSFDGGSELGKISKKDDSWYLDLE